MEEKRKNNLLENRAKDDENCIKKICIEITDERIGIMKFRCNLSPKEVYKRKREVLGVLPECKYPEDHWNIALEKREVSVSFRYDPQREGDQSEQYLPQPSQEKAGWWNYFAFC